MIPDLGGKVAIVTGAGQGIGYSIGARLAALGARVVVAEINADTAQQAAADFSKTGAETLAYPIDIGDTDAVQRMVSDVVVRFGRIDILVNNAGVSEKASLFELTLERWDWLHRVNQRGLFFCLQSVAKQMIAQIPDEVKRAGAPSAVMARSSTCRPSQGARVGRTRCTIRSPKRR